jgi:hypothetical protein
MLYEHLPKVTLDDLASIWMTLGIARRRHRLW